VSGPRPVDARVAQQAARAKFGLLLVIGWLVLIVFPVLVLR
jgi:hypothetical protein